MTIHFDPGVGAVFSADIAVPEHERELRFYSLVLTTGNAPLWHADSLLNNQGVPVIGLGPRTAEHERLPLQWMPHVQVADVAASAARAVELGGSELMHARDDAGGSQWVVLADPDGAAFGVVPVVPAEAVAQSGGAASSDPAAPVGRILWLDLTVPDATKTREFYRQVVGWTVQDVEMKDADARYADYNMLGDDGEPAAGVCHARGVNTGLPPVWMIYLPVGDLAESIRRVEAEGGKILKSMRSADGTYQYVAVQDPVGACFALVQG